MQLFGTKSDTTFYNTLESQAQAACRAAEVFHELVGDFAHKSEHLETLERIEHQADALTHDFTARLNAQFLTPLDKEDLYALTDRLDDITDAIEAAAIRIELYRLMKPRPDLEPLVGLLVAITRETQAMTVAMRKGFKNESLATIISGIHALETRSDKAFRCALMALFDDDGLDCRILIQWKEVYERIEKAINQCEKLASFVEGLRGKYA